MTRFFIVRHGQTKGTENHRYYGRTDMPLSIRGIKQIKKINLDIDYIYTSPLKRCIQTANILGKKRHIEISYIFGEPRHCEPKAKSCQRQIRLWRTIPYSLARDCFVLRCAQDCEKPVADAPRNDSFERTLPNIYEISNDIREIDFGDWEGLTITQMKKRNPRKFNDWLYNFTNFKMPGGESVRGMIRRVERFWRYAINKHGKGNILIVTHGGPAKVIIMKTLGLPMKNFWHLNISTGSVSVIEDGMVKGINLWGRLP